MVSMENIKKQAELLAAENRKSEPHVRRIYWFPDDKEVRLIEVADDVPENLDGRVHPFYFRPSPEDDLPSASDIAMIRPDEFGRLELPEGWAPWSEAVEI